MSVKLDGREVKVGDRLWHFILGWGTVYTTANYTNCAYNRICVRFDLPNRIESFGTDGKSTSDGRNRGLFWDEIKFDIPPPPKKKIKKYQLLVWVPKKPETIAVTESFWQSTQEYDSRPNSYKAISIIKESEIEVDEE